MWRPLALPHKKRFHHNRLYGEMSARPRVGAGTFPNLLHRERNDKMTNPVHAGYGVIHTLEETAQLMGITRERVRQIEKRALADYESNYI